MVGLCKNVGRAVTACAVAALAGVAMADIKAAPKEDAGKPVAIPGMFDLEPSVPNTGPVIVDRIGAPCSQATVNCQELGATNQGSLSSDRVENGTGAGFYSQEDVTFAAAGTLTNLCFWGTYQTPANAPAVGAESFDIVMYADAGGFPGAVLYQANVSQTNGGLARAVAAPGPANYFVWTVALPVDAGHPTGLTVAANECRWLQINGSSTTVFTDRWRWATDSAAATSPNRDRIVIQFGHNDPSGSVDTVISGYALNENFRISGFDLAFCFSQALAPNNCVLPPLANARCSTAQAVAVNAPSLTSATARGLLLPTPFCGANPVNGTTLWYSVNSATTQTLTASTCGATTNFDTVLNVYCGTCTGDDHSLLNCVANNDTGPATCTGTGAAADPSEVTWVAQAGTTYYIAVFGFQITTGAFQFVITGAGDTPTAAACASDRCAVTLPGTLEVDACGASTNSAASCNGGAPSSFVFGVPFGGTCYNEGTQRDFDFWEIAGASIPDTVGDGSAWLDVDYAVEFPGVFNFFNSACATNNGTFIGGAFANYLDGGPACPRAQQTVQLQTAAGVDFRLNLLPIDFGGVPCAPGNNNYRITVRVSTLGACCIPASACFLTVEADCVDVQFGTFLPASTTCGPTDPCVAPVLGACCCATTCSLMSSANCTGTNIAYKGDNTVCNAPGNVTTPCCKADANQSGTVGVQDIFDFLALYFAGNPCADITGTGGVAVQDIFDFLAAYFGGCP